MKLLNIFALVLLFSFGAGCKQEKENSSATESAERYNETSEDSNDDEGYSDGEYCATIDYYNSETGTSSTYTLTVEVEDGRLVKIKWSNGGWLDDTHFDPPDVEEDGSCQFTTNDGKQYDIQINEHGSCNVNSYNSPEDDELEAQKLEDEDQNADQDLEEEP
jgi:hypothetical protein